jgi:hypothetical protein
MRKFCMCAKTGKNQQLWDLGMRAEDMENMAIVTEKARLIKKQRRSR